MENRCSASPAGRHPGPWRRRAAAVLVATTLAAVPMPVLAQYVMDIGNLTLAVRVGDYYGLAEGVDRATTVYVARLSRLAGIRTASGALDRAIADRWRSRRYLQAVVRQSRVAMRALERHGQTLDQVVHVTVTADRTATLYVDDR